MITKRPFGFTKNGFHVTAYTITNELGIGITVLDYGATLQSVVLPHRGERIDVVLGYDTIEEYEKNDGYLGASIGRYAGRIPDAVLRIEDQYYPLTANEGKNQLHGGVTGFDKRLWKARAYQNSVVFRLTASDGEEGFPAMLMCSASYTLNGNVLKLTYRGCSDALTAWNPTNHAYWNLNGHNAGDTRSHLLEIPADRYVPVGADMIPTNGEADVLGTRFDFRKLRIIDGAYDHSFVLNGSPIRLFGNRGIGMKIRTDCKAVQFYNAEFLGKRSGKNDAYYCPFGAVCLETEGRQAFRNEPVRAESVLYGNGCTSSRTTMYRFISKED